MPNPDWPAAREAIDTAISRARREIQATVENALEDLGAHGRRIEAVILSQVKASLDDIDQTIPPEDDDA